MADPQDSNSKSTLSFALRALRYRNYRLFFTGQRVSLVGTWMTRIATSWLVYRLTDSAFLLGLIGFAGQIPSFLLAPIAGVWVDRWTGIGAGDHASALDDPVASRWQRWRSRHRITIWRHHLARACFRE